MAKSTKAQQVSTGTSDSYTADELADPNPPVRIQRAMLGAPPEEVSELSVGMGYSQSSKSATTKSDSESQSRPQVAQTTENPSGQQERETDSTADLMVGDGQTQKEPPPSAEDKKSAAAKKPASKKAHSRSIDDEFM